MKIAVTGGSGFIGAAAIRAAVAEGYDAWSFDRTTGDDILGRLDNLAGADVVIHLAGALGTAELFDDPETAVLLNVTGTLRVLRWCEANGADYVGITMPPVFPSVYTATKVCAERLAEAWRQFRGVRTATVRAFNVYGPGQKHGPGHPRKILPTFATEAWAGRPIPVWGDGQQTVDLVHVDDVGRMLVAAAQRCAGADEAPAVFDAGTGVALTVNQVATIVMGVTGSKVGVKYQPMRPGERPTFIAAEGQGWQELGWGPEYNLARLADAVRSYRP